jgi:hypothetical protein
VWICTDCCCPDGSSPPGSVTLTLSNYRAALLNEAGSEASGGSEYAPPDFFQFSDLSVNGSYTLDQDTFGPFTRLNSIQNRLVSGPSAGNCVFYSYKQAGKKELQAGRWPPEVGTFYYASFSGTSAGGQPMTLSGVFNGGGLYDICTGVGTQPDAIFTFQIYKGGQPAQVFGGGRLWNLHSSVTVSISR